MATWGVTCSGLVIRQDDQAGTFVGETSEWTAPFPSGVQCQVNGAVTAGMATFTLAVTSGVGVGSGFRAGGNAAGVVVGSSMRGEFNGYWSVNEFFTIRSCNRTDHGFLLTRVSG